MPDAPPTLDRSVNHSGRNAARIEHVPAGNCPDLCGYWSAPIAVTPGVNYTITVWFRGDEDIAGKSGVYVTMRVSGAGASYIPLYAFIGMAESPGWTERTATFAIPAAVTSILLDISPWRNADFPDATGVLWIDDVTVVPAP